jgi:hypothetical protein
MWKGGGHLKDTVFAPAVSLARSAMKMKKATGVSGGLDKFECS